MLKPVRMGPMSLAGASASLHVLLTHSCLIASVHEASQPGCACQAVASTGGTISVISIAEARVVAQLQGALPPLRSCF